MNRDISKLNTLIICLMLLRKRNVLKCAVLELSLHSALGTSVGGLGESSLEKNHWHINSSRERCEVILQCGVGCGDGASESWWDVGRESVPQQVSALRSNKADMTTEVHSSCRLFTRSTGIENQWQP